MKNKLILLTSLLPVVGVGTYALLNKYVFYHPLPLRTQKVDQEKQLVVITPTFNNKTYCERQLLSLFNQKHGDGPYKNWSLILVDDNSPDGQFETIQKCVKDHNMESHCTLIKNETRQGVTANVYTMLHSIKNKNAIVLCVDGDDWLAHDRVFERINEIYEDPSVWITYGQLVYWPDFGPIPEHHMPRLYHYKKARDYGFFSSHLRTFYAGLAQKIRPESFKIKDSWIPCMVDVAMMWPMLEMAGPYRVRHVPEILYVYNREPKRIVSEPPQFNHLPLNDVLAYLHQQTPYQQIDALA